MYWFFYVLFFIIYFFSDIRVKMILYYLFFLYSLFILYNIYIHIIYIFIYLLFFILFPERCFILTISFVFYKIFFFSDMLVKNDWSDKIFFYQSTSSNFIVYTHKTVFMKLVHQHIEIFKVIVWNYHCTKLRNLNITLIIIN